MLRIPCPWCGLRDQSEFRNGGEGGVERPANPALATDADWADYLFYRSNPKGLLYERWVHGFGCRQWFIVARDTATHEVRGAYRMGDAPSAGGENLA